MRTIRLLLSVSVLLFSYALVSCGGSTRHLQSITVSPSTASSSAQFSATGIFSQAPSPMMLAGADVGWCGGVPGATGGCPGGNINVIATVDSTGDAQCLPGASGTTTIVAFDPKTLPSGTIPDVAPQPKIFGTAQLTCP